MTSSESATAPAQTVESYARASLSASSPHWSSSSSSSPASTPTGSGSTSSASSRAHDPVDRRRHRCSWSASSAWRSRCGLCIQLAFRSRPDVREAQLAARPLPGGHRAAAPAGDVAASRSCSASSPASRPPRGGRLALAVAQPDAVRNRTTRSSASTSAFYLFELPFYQSRRSASPRRSSCSSALATLATTTCTDRMRVNGRELRISKAARIQLAVIGARLPRRAGGEHLARPVRDAGHQQHHRSSGRRRRTPTCSAAHPRARRSSPASRRSSRCCSSSPRSSAAGASRSSAPRCCS